MWLNLPSKKIICHFSKKEILGAMYTYMCLHIPALFFKNPKSNIGYRFICCVSSLSNTNVKESQSLKSRFTSTHYCHVVLRKLFTLFDPEVIPKFGHNIMILASFLNLILSSPLPNQSSLSCVHTSRYLQAGSSIYSCLNLAPLLVSIPTPSNSAKSYLLSRLTFIYSFWIFKAQNIKECV